MINFNHNTGLLKSFEMNLLKNKWIDTVFLILVQHCLVIRHLSKDEELSIRQIDLL